MDDHTCASCNARNRTDASHCWQCLTPMPVLVPAAPRVVEAGPLALGRVAQPVPAAPQSLLSPLPPAPHLSTSPPLPLPHRAGRSRRGIVAVTVTLAALLVGGLGGWWAVGSFTGGYDFPSEIGGVGLTRTGDAQDLPAIRPTGMTGEVAVYGPPATPDYALVVLDLPKGTDPAIMWERFGMSFDPRTAVVPKDLPSTSRFRCGPNPAFDSGSMCLWMKGDYIYELDAPFSSAAEIEPTAYRLFLEG